MVPDAAADDLGGLMLHQFFTLVAALHTHIFVFDLVDFSVSKQQCFRQRPTGRVWFQAGRAFVLLFKAQGGFRLAAGGIVDFFLTGTRFWGRAARAASSLSAFASAFWMYGCNAGSARSSSVNSKRAAERCRPSSLSAVAAVSAAFFAFFLFL